MWSYNARRLKRKYKFPEPITPLLPKASEGHDRDISREEILKQGIVGRKNTTFS